MVKLFKGRVIGAGRLFSILGCIVLLSGCATTHYPRMSADFQSKVQNIKKIGLLLPIGYENSRGGSGQIFQSAIAKAFKISGAYQFVLVGKEQFPTLWNSDLEKAAAGSQLFLKNLELEGLWKDKKTAEIARKMTVQAGIFKTIDPQLDAILVVKCKQHYGNVWANGLFMFGALGGVIAATTAKQDPVIGRHQPTVNDVYSSALLVDLNTDDVIWYNFALRAGLDVEKVAGADAMATDTLFGLVGNKQ